MEVDASDAGAGAVLLQDDEKGLSHPVCYFLAKLKQHQLNYSTIEKETLAMLLALQHFSHAPVVVYTDHNPLVFVMRMYNHNQRLTRWALLMQGFNIEICVLSDSFCSHDSCVFVWVLEILACLVRPCGSLTP